MWKWSWNIKTFFSSSHFVGTHTRVVTHVRTWHRPICRPHDTVPRQPDSIFIPCFPKEKLRDQQLGRNQFIKRNGFDPIPAEKQQQLKNHFFAACSASFSSVSLILELVRMFRVSWMGSPRSSSSSSSPSNLGMIIYHIIFFFFSSLALAWRYIAIGT